MLTLTAEHNEDGMLTREYDCDFTVTTAGDGLWGCEAGRQVRVTAISVTEEDDYKSIYVTHDTTWDIYTDTGFEDAISEALGYAVTFTEQGMQEDELASME